MFSRRAVRASAAILAAGLLSTGAQAPPGDPLLQAARQEQSAYLDTLRELVSIESGSRDLEGLDRLGQVIAGRLRALGGQVEIVPAGADLYRMEDTPSAVGKSVVARFRGTGMRRILVLAHMDTV
jgi:glutamate carboxypeptidase